MKKKRRRPKVNRNSDVMAVIFVLVAASVAGCVHLWTRTAAGHVLSGIDASLSVEPNCGGVSAFAEGFLNRREIQSGSTLTVISMGVSPSHSAPRLRFHDEIPIADDSIYGRPENERKYKDDLEDLLAGVEQACEAVEATGHTPLYQMVEQGLAHLRSENLKCSGSRRCFFLIKTDLLDDVHPELLSVFNAAIDDPNVSLPPELAGSLANENIEVSVCGTQEVRPPAKRSAPPIPMALRKRIWRELFTRPGLVSFQPFCAADARSR